jgi:FkbM family methyltransferase
MKSQSLFVKRVFRAPNYVRVFGLFHGLRLLLAIEKQLQTSWNRIQAFRVPISDHPVYLRNFVADHATFWQCLVMEQYDFRGFPQFALFQQEYEKAVAAGEKPLIIDGGANIGLAVRWFERLFPEAQFVAVEPDDSNFDLLEKNTAHIRDRVLCLKGGLWDKSARLTIINPAEGASAYRVEEAPVTDTTGLRAYTIPEICAMAGKPAPFVVKLDIEGSQKSLFRSNTDWVKDAHLITLELDDWLFPWSGCNRSFFACLAKLPFDYLIKDESIFCFRDFTGEARQS